MRKAVYAGSFDPLTNGHLWVIRHAAALFDELTVAVGVNPNKHTLFTPEERVEMIGAALSGHANIRVESFSFQYLVHYAQNIGANWIVRGLRSTDDFEYEKMMRYVNEDLAGEIETIFLMPPRDLVEVSSSFVKGLVGPFGWQAVVKNYLPPRIVDRFVRKYAER